MTKSVYEQLEKIAELKEKGILSEEEFQSEKAKLLSNTTIDDSAQNELTNDMLLQFVNRYNGSKKDTWLALLLCLFFGVFGAHKFYRGKIAQGILYLLFSWSSIPFILSIIDFFLLSGQIQKDNLEIANTILNQMSISPNKRPQFLKSIDLGKNLSGIFTAIPIIFVLLIAVLIFGAYKAINQSNLYSNSYSYSYTQTMPGQTPITSYSAEQKQAIEKLLIISNPVAQFDGITNIVSVAGKIKNNDNKFHSVNLVASFFDKNNNLLGTASGEVDNIPTKGDKVFLLDGINVPHNYANFKVQVDAIYN